MDPKRWGAQLPQPVSSEVFSAESSTTQGSRPLHVVHEWPFAGESTVGLDSAANVFRKDLDELKALDDLVDQGVDWCHRLYGPRSISSAITAADGSLSAEAKVLHQKATVAILEPRLREMVVFKDYLIQATKKISLSVSFLLQPDLRKRTLPKAILGRLIALVDVIMSLGLIKDQKTHMTNDITALNRALTSLETSNTDPADRAKYTAMTQAVKHVREALANNKVAMTLKLELHQTPGDFGEIMQDLINFAVTELDLSRFVFPEEKYRLIRFLAYALNLVDHTGSEYNMKPANAFKLKRVDYKAVKHIFKRYPSIPLFADMQLTLIDMLKRCSSFSTMTYQDENILLEWGGFLSVSPSPSNGGGDKSKAEQINDEQLKEFKRNCELTNHWQHIRQEFDIFSAKFQACLRRVRVDALDQVSQEKRAFDAQTASSNPLAPDAPPENPDARRRRHKTETLDKEAYDVTLEGLRLLGKWKGLLWEQMAFKYFRGAPPSADQSPDSPFFVYDSVVRFNHSPLELVVLYDVVCTLKMLASMISNAAPFLAMPIRRRIHHDMQEFAQLRLLRMCHTANKRKKQHILSLLSQLRSVCIDWTGMNPNDYKEKKLPRKLKEYEKRSGLTSVEDDEASGPVPANTSTNGVEDDRYIAGASRTVGPSPAQLTLIRAFIEHIRDPDKNEGLLEGFFEGLTSFMSSADLDRPQAEQLKEFYNRSFFFPYVLSLRTCVDEISSLYFLWHREFYLDICKQQQFPISSSLPWITLEEMLMKSGANAPSMTDSILFFLSIYNDAADFALKKLKQRHLYDEVEAEGQLVFMQFEFFLTESVYTHFKMVNAGRLLDKTYKAKLQDLKRGKVQARSIFSAFAGGAGGSEASQQVRLKYLETENRRFTGVLGEHSFRFLGRTIDVAKLVGESLNRYILGDVEKVLEKFEDSGITSSHELETLLKCVKGTHEDLSRLLRLDDFADILEQADERIAAGLSPKTRLTRFAEKQLIFEIVERFCYCSVTERFVPPPSVDPPRKSKTQSLPNQLYGRMFKDAFAKAHALETEFLDVEHIDALVSAATFGLSSSVLQVISPHGMASIILAYLADTVLEHTKTVINDLAELLKMFTAKLAETKVSIASSPDALMVSTAQTYSDFSSKVVQVVPFGDNRTKTLQLLKEFGNALALLRLLHKALEKVEMRAFIATSHASGLDSFVPRFPDQVGPPMVESAAVLSQLSATVSKDEFDHVKDEVAIDMELFRSPGLERNAYLVLIEKVRERLSESCGIDFLRIANLLQFSFASTSGGNPTAVPPQEGDETKLGDGVIWAIQFSMFSLGLVASFEHSDLCERMAQVDAVERLKPEDAVKEPTASSNLAPFLSCVRETIKPTKALVSSMLSVLFYEREYEKGNALPLNGRIAKENIVLYHPPEGYFDETTGEPIAERFAKAKEAKLASSYAPTRRTSYRGETVGSISAPASAMGIGGGVPPPPIPVVSAQQRQLPQISSHASVPAPPAPSRGAPAPSGPNVTGGPPPAPPRTVPQTGAPPPPPRAMGDMSGPPPPPVRTTGAPPPPPRSGGIQGPPPPAPARTVPPPPPAGESAPELPPRDFGTRPQSGHFGQPQRPPRSRTGES